MKVYGVKPTKFQSAVAMATAYLLQVPNEKKENKVYGLRKKRILVEVPPAGGKSRISI